MYRNIGFKISVLNTVYSMLNVIVNNLKIGFFCLRLYLKMQTTASFLAIISIRPYCTKVLKYRYKLCRWIKYYNSYVANEAVLLCTCSPWIH